MYITFLIIIKSNCQYTQKKFDASLFFMPFYSDINNNTKSVVEIIVDRKLSTSYFLMKKMPELKRVFASSNGIIIEKL